MIVIFMTVFHTLGKITLQKSRTGYHIFGRIIKNCGPAETIFGQKSGPAMAGPTTALAKDMDGSLKYQRLIMCRLVL